MVSGPNGIELTEPSSLFDTPLTKISYERNTFHTKFPRNNSYEAMKAIESSEVMKGTESPEVINGQFVAWSGDWKSFLWRYWDIFWEESWIESLCKKKELPFLVRSLIRSQLGASWRSYECSRIMHWYQDVQNCNFPDQFFDLSWNFPGLGIWFLEICGKTFHFQCESWSGTFGAFR